MHLSVSFPSPVHHDKHGFFSYFHIRGRCVSAFFVFRVARKNYSAFELEPKMMRLSRIGEGTRGLLAPWGVRVMGSGREAEKCISCALATARQ